MCREVIQENTGLNIRFVKNNLRPLFYAFVFFWIIYRRSERTFTLVIKPNNPSLYVHRLCLGSNILFSVFIAIGWKYQAPFVCEGVCVRGVCACRKSPTWGTLGFWAKSSHFKPSGSHCCLWSFFFFSWRERSPATWWAMGRRCVCANQNPAYEPPRNPQQWWSRLGTENIQICKLQRVSPVPSQAGLAEIPQAWNPITFKSHLI